MTAVVAKLDEIGRPAWIALMVAGFLVFFPLGLAILAYTLWSGRMRGGMCGNRGRWHNERQDGNNSRHPGAGRAGGSGWSGRSWGGNWGGGPRFEPTGNVAFDEYREETLKRLEQEAKDFQEFLSHLRMARDKAEFDQYMADRRNNPTPTQPPAEPSAA